jgi:hypothetical protein
MPKQFKRPPVYSQLCHIGTLLTATDEGAKKLLKSLRVHEIPSGIPALIALKRGRPLGGRAFGMANLGGGGHPFVRAA